MSVQTGPVQLDTADFRQDPEALYARLRRGAPVCEALFPRGFRGWLVTRYDDAKAALTDPRLSKDMSRFAELMTRHHHGSGRFTPFPEDVTAHMLNSDPPDHTRLRRLVNRAFTIRGVAKMAEGIEAITDELLDGLAGRTEVDLLDAFAFPLPITVISDLLGVPHADREDFRAWTSAVISKGAPGAAAAAARAMGEYLGGLIEAKRAHPTDDLLSALVEAHDDGDRLSAGELRSMAFLLLIAGHETTVNLIGNGVLALLRNPDQLAALRADRSLLPGAVEEFLRYEGPVNVATFRYTTEPVELGGVRIPEGEFVMVALASANRDDAHVADAGTLDITRPQTPHLAFGHGIHYCVGAPLARLEATTAIGGLLDRFPDLALAAEPEELLWRPSTLVRGLETLPVRLA
ncbi:cytochrome P450 family protein [Actinokineospora bangkokensis]|uniref:Cytochrome n=1 Tax=Actinokineospora bangkokensis TaxID=1193682 RepID=A0A1Q9LQD9_9PSEU|nr:cytochrome P450 [Actinokineospora bangkokensis]OLR94214.1 cytochrome [Actinokineospora bangkokensis]